MDGASSAMYKSWPPPKVGPYLALLYTALPAFRYTGNLVAAIFMLFTNENKNALESETYPVDPLPIGKVKRNGNQK